MYRLVLGNDDEYAEYVGHALYLIEEWSQFFSACNWYTFHPIKVELEDDRAMGGVELTVIVLGIGFRWRWNYTKTERVADMLEAIENITNDRGNLP